MDAPVAEAVRKKPAACGLAVIISNDYNTTPGLQHLSGTVKDGEKMNSAFQFLKFATVWQHNVTRGKLMQLLSDISRYPSYPTSYKCIAFVFSGHGLDANQLYMQDGSLITVWSIVESLLPKRARQLGTIPKLFFIDACRGSRELSEEAIIVPRHASPSSGRVQETLQKGGVDATLCVPPEGNFLIAYSTMPYYRSYELKGKGGLWMQYLAEKLRTSNQSIQDILSETNKELMEVFQAPEFRQAMIQPDCISRLHGRLCLQPEGMLHQQEGWLPLCFTFISEPTSSGSQYTPPSVFDPHGTHQASSVQSSVLQPSHYRVQSTDGKPPGHYRGVLNHYVQTGVVQSFNYHDQEQYDNANMQMCYLCSVSVTLLNDPRPVVGSSQAAFPQKQKAREEAARNAVHQIEHLKSNHTHLQPDIIFTGSATPNYTESFMSEDARVQLNHFCQTHSVKPQFSFLEDASSGQCRYKCTISYRINGKAGRIDSPGYHASKAKAKEQAARILIETETQVNAISSRGPSPTAKIWKSKLKEYYDKSGRAEVQPKYVTKECSKDGFQCTLYSPEIGYIRGDICRSKSEAEQSAAYKALQKLKQV